MASVGFPAESTATPRAGRLELAARGAFVALLASMPFLPEIKSSLFEYPAVTNWWVCLPLCALFLLALADLRRPLCVHNLDLLALGSFAFALGGYAVSRSLPEQLLYPPLAYLTVRMLWLARIGRGSPAPERGTARAHLPWRLLLAGVIVLGAVHVHWALSDPSTSDVGKAGAWGAEKLLQGERLYGVDRKLSAKLGEDPHYDTYGPFDYEAYVPFVLMAGSVTAARLTSLFFCLLAAALLFALGKRMRGPPTGLTMAFAWLAYPFTLYSDGFDFNDALLAATLAGALLLAGSASKRGALTALAGWTKLSPLALVPLMLAHASSPEANPRRSATRFCAGFALGSLVVFLPVLDHLSLDGFLSRTVGYQADRPPAYTIWALYGSSFHNPPWLVDASKVTHGILVALTAGLVLALARLPRRHDLIGLAAACAAVLMALQICDGYYSFSYLLWFVPPVLVVLACGESEHDETLAVPRPEAEEARGDARHAPTVRTRRRPAERHVKKTTTTS